MKYFVYCRKSTETEDRQILSLDSQENELKRIVEENHLNVVQTYKESGSAHVIGRKMFNEMIARIENGDANGLIVWDESRIARNTFDGGKIVYMIDMNQIVEIRKPGKTYKNTPDDKSWLQMTFMMSKKESDDKSVNVTRGMTAKADKGWFPGAAKPGYTNEKYAEKGTRRIFSDPIRFPLIRKCWELMISGAYRPPQILDKLNNEWGYRSPTKKMVGGKPMANSQIYRVFNDPFYYGEYEYPMESGHWCHGNHEPMITKEEFDRVQVLIGRKHAIRPQTHTFAFTGIIRCGECGGLITAEEKWQVICSNCKFKFSSVNRVDCPKCLTKISEMTKPTISHYTYYHCGKKTNPNCQQRSVYKSQLENEIESFLSKIIITDDFKNWALKYLNKLNDSEVKNRNAIVSSWQSDYQDCLKKLDNLVKLKISPQNSDGSLLTDEEYRNTKSKLVAEKEQWETKAFSPNNLQ